MTTPNPNPLSTTGSRSPSPIEIDPDSDNEYLNLSTSTDQFNTPPPSPTQEENEHIDGQRDQVIQREDSSRNLENGEIHFSTSFEGDGDQSPTLAPLYIQNENLFDDNNNDNEPGVMSDDQDDNVSVIRMDDNIFGTPDNFNFDRWQWTNDDVEQERRRRITALQEIEQMQRSNFLHFVLLCLVPTSLLLILVVTVMGSENVCESSPVSRCILERKSFFNPFASRCICDSIQIFVG